MKTKEIHPDKKGYYICETETGRQMVYFNGRNFTKPVLKWYQNQNKEIFNKYQFIDIT